MKSSEVMELLRKAKAKIEDPRHWTQGVAARDNKDLPVCGDDPRAVKWCAIGALVAVASKGAPHLFSDLQAALEIVADVWVSYTNDVEGHAATMMRFDRAIQKVEAAQ